MHVLFCFRVGKVDQIILTMFLMEVYGLDMEHLLAKVMGLRM